MNIEQRLLEHYINRHTPEVLSTVEALAVEEIIGILESIPSKSAALILRQMDRLKAAQCLEKINIALAVKLIEHISTPYAEILLRLVNIDFCNILLDELPEKIAQNLRRIVRYANNTVGANLNIIAFTVSQELSVKMALEKIEKDKPELQSHLYILDRNQVLIGSVEIKKLITADRNKSIQSIMNSNPPKIMATINISSIAENESWDKSFSELPVVDMDGVFLGILSKEVLKKFNPDSKSIDQNLYKTGAALGELYKIGLASFLRITSEISAKPALPTDRQNLK